MSTVVTVTIPTEEFPLAATLSQFDKVEVEFERTVTAGSSEADTVNSYCWLRADDETLPDGTDADPPLTAMLAADPSVAEYRRLVTTDTERLYHFIWSTHSTAQDLLGLLDEHGVIFDVLREGGSPTWAIRLLFMDRSDLADLHNELSDRGISVEVDFNTVTDTADGDERVAHGLTDKQQKALHQAYRQGYYEIPRAVTATELGDLLGISHQAMSELLRRGHKRAVEAVLEQGIRPSSAVHTRYETQ